MGFEDSSTSSNMPQAHLLGLPNELLLYIIPNLTHDDLENFSGSCKYAHSICKEAMTSHLEKKRLYALVETPTLPSFAYGLEIPSASKYRATSMEIITDALDNEGILGGYVKRLVLRCTTLPPLEIEALRRSLRLRSSISIGHPAEHAAKCPCTDHLLAGHDLWLHNALLFVASTRLKWLDIDRSAAWRLATYIDFHLDKPGTELPAALKSLETVRVGQLLDEGGSLETALGDILPFTGLPGMHTLQLHHLVKPGLLRERSPVPPGSIASLVKLELLNSLITAEGLALILTPTKFNTIEHFTYEVNLGSDHALRQYDWDSRSIIREIRHHGLESLTHLTIIGSHHVKIMGQRSCDGFIGSLTTFARLQHVHLECYMLIFKRRYGGRPIVSGDDSDDGLSDLPTQSIVDLFPPSLETLKLVRRDQADVQMKRMLAGVVVGCEALPRLKEVVVQQAEATYLSDSEVEFLRRAGY
ncbi:MAG: hypothetical protein Q9199_005586 [Rusavskia elegans]